MSDKTVLLIMGSTRAGRICPPVAGVHHYEGIDLAERLLPMDDEPAGTVHAGAHPRLRAIPGAHLPQVEGAARCRLMRRSA